MGSTALLVHLDVVAAVVVIIIVVVVLYNLAIAIVCRLAIQNKQFMYL